MANPALHDFQNNAGEVAWHPGAVSEQNARIPVSREAYDALVLDANSRKVLATVRCLGKRGLRVAALECSNALPVPAFSSRWCRKKFICPVDEGTEAYLLYLEALLDAERVQVLIPSSDGTIALVRQYRERLERRVQIALASEAALSIAVSKERTLEVARRLGLNVPRGVTVRDASGVEHALEQVGLPAVVKPAESWIATDQQSYRVASQLVTTPVEAHSAVEELTRDGGAVLFQQFLSGRREAIALFYARGEIAARFAYWSRREEPPLGGTWALAQSMAYPPDIGEQAERLVREINLEGYSQIEFRRDSLGTPYLMEINARLTAGLEHPIQAGVDFPYLLYQWASGKRVDTVKRYRAGVWMRYLWGDIAATISAIQQRGRPGVTSPVRAIVEFCTTCFVPMRYDYVDWRDPLPIWTAIAARGLGGLRRAGRLLAWKGRRKAERGSETRSRKAEASHV